MELQSNTMPRPIARQGLDRNMIKYILIIAMVIDHLADFVVPTWSVPGQIMHFIGRLTGPGMSLLLAEGYQYTTNKRRYALRLFIFAAISWIPYSLCFYGEISPLHQSVIFTFFIAFITIWMWDKLRAPKPVKIILVVLLCLSTIFADWYIIAVIWVFFAYIFRDKPKAKWISFVIIALIKNLFLMVGNDEWYIYLYQFGALMVPLLLIYGYNGKKGSPAGIHKWFFYIFYPAHLLLLWALFKFVF